MNFTYFYRFSIDKRDNFITITGIINKYIYEKTHHHSKSKLTRIFS